MSGLISGIGKVFSTVTSGIARVGQAVLGVGATTFTAGAANAAAPMATGGLSGLVQKFVGGGVLGNVLTGAITSAGYGALIGGAVSAATGGSFMKGALYGGLGGALTGGLAGASGINLDPFAGGGQAPPATNTGVAPAPAAPTGMAPTGGTSPTFNAMTAPSVGTGTALATTGSAAPATTFAPVGGTGVPTPAGNGLGSFLTSETGGSLIAGLGKGLGDYMTTKAAEEQRQADRQYLIDRDQKITDSYKVGAEAMHGPATTTTGQPTPAENYTREPRYRFVKGQGVVFA